MVRRLVATAKGLIHLYRAGTADFAHHVRRTGTTTALPSTSAFAMSPCLAEAKATVDIRVLECMSMIFRGMS